MCDVDEQETGVRLIQRGCRSRGNPYPAPGGIDVPGADVPIFDYYDSIVLGLSGGSGGIRVWLAASAVCDFPSCEARGGILFLDGNYYVPHYWSISHRNSGQKFRVGKQNFLLVYPSLYELLPQRNYIGLFHDFGTEPHYTSSLAQSIFDYVCHIRSD